MDSSKFEPGLNESCGLFGCILADGTTARDFPVADCVYAGLNSLQHR